MRCSTRMPTARCRGFTLVEVMVVILILGLLATLVIPNLWHSHAAASTAKAKVDLSQIYDAARIFTFEHGAPPTIEQLAARDRNGDRYLESLPRDPWDHDYVLRVVEGNRCQARSAGPDGVLDTEDDLVAPPA